MGWNGCKFYIYESVSPQHQLPVVIQTLFILKTRSRKVKSILADLFEDASTTLRMTERGGCFDQAGHDRERNSTKKYGRKRS